MDLKNFKKRNDWVSIWSGKWSLHSCSHFGQQWTETSKVSGKVIYPLVVYVNRKGINTCWVSNADKDDLGKRLTSLVKKDPSQVKIIANALKSNADILFSFAKENLKKEATSKMYEELWKIVATYYIPHISVKYIVDYLSKEDLEKYLPMFEDARLYSEQAMKYQEDLMDYIADQVAKKTGLTKELVLCTSKEELRKYFKSGKLPKKSVLEERFIEAVQFFDKGKAEIFSGKEAADAEKIVLPQADESGIKGQIAYKGNASGRVRIVINAYKYKGPFEEGDILVTGMTRPEFLPLMKKAAAFVTDAGGILSHAAIVAREMKKPCVIGTGIATKTLKDGDLVEVDANNGTVKILKKK